MHIRLIPHYLMWHYTLGVYNYLSICKGLIHAVAHIFSLSFLFLKTFFEPFERLNESYSGGISKFFEAFVVNSLMRMVGVGVRLCVIIIGTLFLILAFVFCVVGFFVWLSLPIIVFLLLYAAVFNFFKVV